MTSDQSSGAVRQGGLQWEVDSLQSVPVSPQPGHHQWPSLSRQHWIWWWSSMLLLILVISFLTSMIDTYSGVRPRYDLSQSHKFPVMNIKFKIVSCRQQLILSKYWIRLVKDLNITCLLLQNALSPRGISGWRNYFNFNLSTNLNIFLRLLKNCFVSVLTKRSPLLPMLENCPIYTGTQPIRCKTNIWSTLPETRSWR